jgi:hypothetical protein
MDRRNDESRRLEGGRLEGGRDCGGGGAWRAMTLREPERWRKSKSSKRVLVLDRTVEAR